VEPDGFTLLEVLVAITILAIGLMGMALLMTNTYKFSMRSRYMAEAAQLCTEKLEDLGRFPQNDEHVTVNATDTTGCPITGGSCEGSLSSDVGPVNITTAGATIPVYYYDAVYISMTNGSGGNGTIANGSFQETYEDPNSSSTTCGNNDLYVTLTFSPQGTTPAAQCSASAPTTGETFERRWIIEQDQPVVGVRRITVRVILEYTAILGLGQISPPVFSQMSMVRQ
jgi:type IV pilus modification protein PilV